MTKLKLHRIDDDKPVRLTLDLPASLHRDLLPTVKPWVGRPAAGPSSQSG
jgi:hypothetical protein